MSVPPCTSLFASAISTSDDTGIAIDELIENCRSSMTEPPDWIMVFFTIGHDADLINQRLSASFPKAVILGCTAESILGGDREIERAPGMTLWMARLPDVDLETVRLEYLPEVDEGTFTGWTSEFMLPWPDHSILILLGEPFTFPADRLGAIFNEDHPGVSIIGGIASGGDRPGSHRLILNGNVYSDGAVALRLASPNLLFRTFVSQGCRPIGRPLVITKADRNLIFELGGKSALLQLHEILEALPAADRDKARSGIHVGRVMNEYQELFKRGDFLVRNVIGADQQRGCLAVGDFVKAGQTVQFQIRDADSADDELQELLSETLSSSPMPAGALLFTCNGRGSRLFPQPNHDAAAVSQAIQGAPLAGFFAAGELGPVGGKNYLHGFSASIIIFF